MFFNGCTLNLKEAAENGRATIFGYYVHDSERFRIVVVWKVISVEEKPQSPNSNYCITRLYFYDNRVVEFAKKLNHQIEENLKLRI